jgi:hypothetical protein
VPQVKVLINSLFCGARLGCNSQFALSQLFGGNRVTIELLKANPWLSRLRSEIKACWQQIEPTMTTKYVTETGRKIPLNSRAKWGRYFELERQVLNSVRSYLVATGNRHFLIHDGWTTEQPVDIHKLVEYIAADTGYYIGIEAN